MDETLERVRAGEEDPPCLECGGMLKSATICFGENLVAADLERAQRAAAGADLFLAFGTSLGVYPAAAPPGGRPRRRRPPGDPQRRAHPVRRPGHVRRARPARPGAASTIVGPSWGISDPRGSIYRRYQRAHKGTPNAQLPRAAPRRKQHIREIQPEEAEAASADATFLDVREQDEYDAGTIPGSVFIPRGHLESQVETKLPDRDQPVVIYCAGGIRSAFAAETLQQLGYTDVVSMAGGFGQWKNEGRPWITPQSLTAEQRDRYKRHILLPEVGEDGQQKLLETRVLLLGAGGLGSPAALYLAAAGVGTLGIVDMDVVDASNLQRQILHNMDRIGERKVDSAKKTLTRSTPT